MRPSTLSFRRLATLRPSQYAFCSTTRLQSTLSQRPFASRTLRSARLPFAPFRRHESSLVYQGEQDKQHPESAPRDEPTYQLTFTCKPCLHRSTHNITKHGYHKGTVLITCPSCANRHVISDHLQIFMDEKSTLEDILRAKGEENLNKLLKKGKLGIRQDSQIGNEGEENLEFWEDGSQTEHNPN